MSSNPFGLEKYGKISSTDELARKLATDDKLLDHFKSDPLLAINAIAKSPIETDVIIYRIVVISLGLAVVMSIGLSAYLSVYDKKLPEIFMALGSAAVGALAGLLAPSPGSVK